MNELQPIQPGAIMWCVPNREYPQSGRKVTVIEPDPNLKRFWWCSPEHGKFRVRYHESALEPLV